MEHPDYGLQLDSLTKTWRFEIPAIPANIGHDFILQKDYTTTMPTSWILQEIADRNMADGRTKLTPKALPNRHR